VRTLRERNGEQGMLFLLKQEQNLFFLEKKKQKDFCFFVGCCVRGCGFGNGL
jgi:hypothetical protein